MLPLIKSTYNRQSLSFIFCYCHFFFYFSLITPTLTIKIAKRMLSYTFMATLCYIWRGDNEGEGREDDIIILILFETTDQGEKGNGL